MSHSNSNENQTEANYAAVEINEQSKPPRSNQSQLNLINNVLSPIRNMWEQNGAIKLVIVALGIFSSFFIIGILQEKIIKVPYVDSDGNKERFQYEFTLIGVQYFCTFVLIKGVKQFLFILNLAFFVLPQYAGCIFCSNEPRNSLTWFCCVNNASKVLRHYKKIVFYI